MEAKEGIAPGRIDTSVSRPLLVYDGKCAFCRAWTRRRMLQYGNRFESQAYQELGDRLPDLKREDLEREMHLVLPKGPILRGADAILHVYTMQSGRHWIRRAIERTPAARHIAQWLYRRGAAHRRGLSRIYAFLFGENNLPGEHRWTRALFLRLLALIYLVAFLSIWSQANGLYGEQGILPLDHTMRGIATTLQVEESLSASAFMRFPTIFWWIHSDWAMTAVCTVGVMSSVIALSGVASSLTFFVLWFAYLSICTVGGSFLSFQWDILLLEVGFLAIFFATWQIRPSVLQAPKPSPLLIFLYRFLLFKLMWGSGLVKIASGDATWWPNLDAMGVHYETQCIPNPLAWYIHQLPESFHRLSTAGTLGIELFLPFLIWTPRRIRFVGAAAMATLQGFIFLTGNYTFFNLLTLILCIPLLDDGILSRRTQRQLEANRPPERSFPLRRAQYAGLSLLAILWISISGWILMHQFNQCLALYDHGKSSKGWAAWAGHLQNEIRSWRSINSYGLFAHMTTERPEIIVQGSHDGQVWSDYSFRYKPGALDRRPPQVAPHQPRLDWQMWFAALGSIQSPRTQQWMLPFLVRLLEGSPDVLDLLGENPFPDDPPRYIRALVYDYRFTDHKKQRQTGQWWHRESERVYCPPLSLNPEVP